MNFRLQNVNALNCTLVEVEVEVNLRPTVSRPVCLGVRRPSGAHDQFFFLLEISFRQLRVCYFEAPSLTRGLICNLLYNCFWALPEQSLLGRSPSELTIIFYCLIWDPPNLEGQVPVFISPRNRVAQLYPRALGSLYVASYYSQVCGGGILTRLHTGCVRRLSLALLIYPLHGPRRKRRVVPLLSCIFLQQFLHCRGRIRCHENVYMEHIHIIPAFSGRVTVHPVYIQNASASHTEQVSTLKVRSKERPKFSFQKLEVCIHTELLSEQPKMTEHCCCWHDDNLPNYWMEF
jgi:hypothetical protein